MMSALDDQMTDVMDGFKNKGIWDNTLWIFTTDNGGNLGGDGINFPLRGGKYTFWQGGCRGNSFITGGKHSLAHTLKHRREELRGKRERKERDQTKKCVAAIY